jgi:Holliday junction resolvase
MSKYERDKGNRIEREIINLHKENGIHAERIPLSGATRYQSRGYDVDIYAWGKNDLALKAEVKGRASGAGFTMLERWLADYDVLFLRRDRQEPLVVVPWQVWIDLVRCVEAGRNGATTSTQPRPSARPDDATCAKREVTRSAKGDDDDHTTAAEPR